MFAGVTVPYIIGNESMTAAPGTGAATWGGQANYSNNSGQNTHFIGHNPGSFAAMLSLGIGSPITVTDAAGNPRTYHVYQLATVNPRSSPKCWCKLNSANLSFHKLKHTGFF